jgi:putative GTP pyrophosphokinase
MNKEQIEEYRAWYISKRPVYEGLSDIVRSTIESLLKNADIDYLSVSCRTKTLDSFLEKIQRKEYKTPEDENTDFSGVRIITYIESDVSKVGNIIKESFKVYPKLSFDKSEELGVDRFGYRSVHFVCDLGSDRTKLPEFKLYNGLKFEVQVRTVLQHAWAEIEHDRNYKFSGILPTLLQRRLYSLSGLLEIVDREFVSLSEEIDKYSEDVAQKTKAGNLDVEVNTTSLMQFLPSIEPKLEGIAILPLSGPTDIESATEELQSFGIKTLDEVNKLFSENFRTLYSKHIRYTTYTGLLRAGLMYADIERYFETAWQNHWQFIGKNTYDFLVEKYDTAKVKAILQKNKIESLPKRSGALKRTPSKRKIKKS